MIKAVIFDLDGVIVSTDKYHYLAWKQLADKYSIYFDKKINERLRGISRPDSLEIILEKATRTFSENEKKQMLEFKNQLYLDFIKKMRPSDVDSEVIAIIEYLKNQKIKIAIGSSSKNTKTILKQIGLINTFDAIVDGTMITKSKPDPEVFTKAGLAVSVNPAECLVVEDAVAGIDAGKSAGMLTLAVGSAQNYNCANYSMDKLDYAKFNKIIQGGKK